LTIYFQQTIGIPIGTNCARLTYFLQGLIKNKDRKLAQTFNSSFRYIDCCHWTIRDSVIIYIHRIIQMNLKLRILLMLKSLLLTFLRRKIKNKTPRQTQWLHFSNSQLLLHQ